MRIEQYLWCYESAAAELVSLLQHQLSPPQKITLKMLKDYCGG